MLNNYKLAYVGFALSSQHILIDQKQQKNIIYVEKQGPTIFQWGLARTKSFKLVKDSELMKSKMLIFCTLLIFACILMTSDRYLLDRQQKSHMKHFYVHEKCKISDFKFPKVMQQHIQGVVGKLMQVLL